MAIPQKAPDSAVLEAQTALDDRTPVVFVTGRAGTGKSHFIRSLVEADPGFPQAGHGSIKLPVLFNDPADPE